MIRSTKITLDSLNQGKLNDLNSFIDEYRRLIVKFIDILWEIENVPSLIPNEITSKVSTHLSKRIVQCTAKQASAIVRGCKKKQEKRLYQINKFISLNQPKKARKLQHIYNKTKISKPNITNIPCELDERFVKINLNKNETSFEGWITLCSLGNKLNFQIPFNKHKHFNKMLENGNIKKGIRISNNSITFMFELPEPKLKETGKTLGIDIGQKTTLSCSDGQSINECPHGHTYMSICEKLARKKKGSKNFNKTVKHRNNYLKFIVNNLKLDGVKVVNRENIKNLRKFKNVSKKLKHWNYGELFNVLDNKLNEHGVHVNKLNPTYTSQRCSSCGWVRKGNRKGKQFKCDKCSFEQDSDLNASLNLSLNLSPIGKIERLKRNNKKGFYWNVLDKEFIVPNTQKVNDCDKTQ